MIDAEFCSRQDQVKLHFSCIDEFVIHQEQID